MMSFCCVVNKFSDKIAYCHMAQPLPPVFRDGPKSHPNHMIESAQNGLALASRKFVLRTRNDLLFKDRSFVDEYIRLSEKYFISGEYTSFSEPVMISSLYTLNPYAEARLPFHYGDWFNFGKLSDVKAIWNVPFVTLDFMTYYSSNYYRPGSFEKERNFFSQMAIEQYIYFTYFSSKFKDLKLDYHNDDRSIAESIQILLDNFIVADIYNLNVYYPKYNNGFNAYMDNNTRIMQQTWEYLASHRDIEPAKLLQVSREKMRQYEPRIFPLRIESDQLFSKNGFHFEKSIIVSPDSAPGVFCFGPFITIKKGFYTVSAAISTLHAMEDNCNIMITLSGEEGKIKLSSKKYTFNKSRNYMQEYIYLNIDFENPYDSLERFEVVIQNDDRADIALDYIVISKIYCN